MRNPLLDLDFLRRLDLTKDKATYAKIILLTWNEDPVEEIQGKITAGSVNIDGASAVRRTCSLTMVSDKVDINNTYWALKNKFKLEVGVENTIDSRYPDIIWFKQGLYVFTSLNMSVQSNNFTISLNGKDKMCLLNGEVGGSINASTDFGKLEEYDTLDNGEIVRNIIDIPIVDIIKNAVHTYAGEPLHNIILNDIDNYGLELLEYRGDKNLYMPRKISTGDVNSFIINPKQKYYLKNGESIYVDNEANKDAGNKELIYYDRTGLNEHSATKVWATPGSHSSSDPDAYNIIKIEYGETAGYRRTDLTYPGELVANVGESLMSILDKIKNMFGDFEYFYDIDGRFIFQKKKTYVNTSFNNLVTSEKDIYAEDAAYTSSTVYSFEEGQLLTAFTNAPQILNIKNDFSIWGKRKGVSGVELPVHMRYAIDFKPTYYRPIRFEYEEIELNEKTYRPNKYYTYIEEIDKYVLATSTSYDDTKKPYYEETDTQILDTQPFEVSKYDWREIIYQMALDYFKYNHKKDNFTQLVAAANPDYYPTGITGYETYYTDMQGFWRQLYHPGVIDKTYDLFSRQELLEAAREVILQERELIEKEDVAQMFIDYVYDNFSIARDNFINQVDFSKEIEDRVAAGLDETSLVVQELLDNRWEKMHGADPYDYEKLMEEEAEKHGTETTWYKTLRILRDYKEKQLMEETNYSQLISNKIEEGYSKNSYVIQELLAARWKKMDGNDPYDYEQMKLDYINGGGDVSDAWYETLTILGEYKEYLTSANGDIAGLIKTYIENGTINQNFSAVQDLLIIRWRKMGNKDNYDYDALMEEEYEKNGDSDQYKLLQILNTFKIEQENVNNDISLIIEQYVKSGFTEKSTVIQDLLARRWGKMGGEDIYNYTELMDEYLESGGKKQDSRYKTLKILNNYKIQQVAINGNYDTIDFSLEIEALIKQGYHEDSHKIQELLVARWEKIGGNDSYDYLQLMEEEYIKNGESARYQTLVILNDFKNNQKQTYIDKEKILIKEQEKNNFDIVDSYLSFLYDSRQKKIDNFGSDIKVVSNQKFVWVITQVIKTLNWTKSDFKEKVALMLDQQINKEAYDFSQEIIDFISDNYENRDTFFYTDAEGIKIYVKHPHIQYLLDMRQEKIYEMGNDVSYLENDALIKIIFEIINTASSANGFKTQLNSKMEEVNKTLSTDYSQEIIDFIYNNYDTSVKFDEETKKVSEPLEKKEDGSVEIKNTSLQTSFNFRKEKIDTYTNFQIFIDNTQFAEELVGAINDGQQDKEKYKEGIQTRLKSAVTTKKNLNASPTASILVRVVGNAFSEVSDEQVLKKLGTDEGKEQVVEYFKENFDENGWNVNIKTAPETLNFWFDFMDTEGEMGKYAAKTIGNRPKAINNDKVTAIYFQETPSVMFLTPEQHKELIDNPEDFVDMTGYTFVSLQPFMENYFTISGQGKSAKDELDTLLYQHTYATETTTLTAVPIYHLQPNTRVFIKDSNTGINGEYIISKITVPLQYNGTSSITTTKAVERIY